MKYRVIYTESGLKKPEMPDEGAIIELNSLDDLHAFITRSGSPVIINTEETYVGCLEGADAIIEVYNEYRE